MTLKQMHAALNSVKMTCHINPLGDMYANIRQPKFHQVARWVQGREGCKGEQVKGPTPCSLTPLAPLCPRTLTSLCPCTLTSLGVSCQLQFLFQLESSVS